MSQFASGTYKYIVAGGSLKKALSFLFIYFDLSGSPSHTPTPFSKIEATPLLKIHLLKFYESNFFFFIWFIYIKKLYGEASSIANCWNELLSPQSVQ